MSEMAALLSKISWSASGAEIEAESLRRIEAEAPCKPFSGAEWTVARRLVHASADFSLLDLLRFDGDPVDAIRKALSLGAPIFSDSNMIKAGLSVERLRKLNKSYSKDSLLCHIADPDVAAEASTRKLSRALLSVRKAKGHLHGSVALVGNAPLALAEIVRLSETEGIKPAVVIGMPVGFVNVVESKALLFASGIPYISIEGRRGGSPLAVAALHGAIEDSGGS